MLKLSKNNEILRKDPYQLGDLNYNEKKLKISKFEKKVEKKPEIKKVTEDRKKLKYPKINKNPIKH